jgi:glucokinase
MVAIHTITASDMRAINRSAILDLIRQEGPLARTAIAERLQVSLPTVMRIVDGLTAEGLVVQTGTKEWSGGRKRPLVTFNAAGQLVIGVDLGGTKMYGALADLGGTILVEIDHQGHQTQGEDSYQCLAGLVRRLLEQAHSLGKPVRGIGVGAPGITLYQTGVIRLAPSLGWVEFPLKARLMADFALPAVVENDVNLAALGELWFGQGRSATNLVVIAVGTGIGAGVVLDRGIYRGSHQAAGEIGYLLPDRSLLGQAYEGFGALELLASGSGIAERARALLASQLLPAPKAVTAELVFEAAERGEAWAHQVVDETVDYLALAIAAVSLCFDPDIIVLGGGVARSARLLIDPILARLERALPVAPHLVASSLGYRATVMGSIIHLLHSTSDFYIVRKLS